MRHKWAAQLYTLRNELKLDFHGTLRELKKMGWAAVQIDGLHGHDPAEVAGWMKQLGLQTAGMHVGLERMKFDLPAVLREADLFWTRDFICHSLPDELMNRSGYESVRRDLRQVSLEVSASGYRVGYHNHDFEFHTRIGDQYALDYVLEWDECSPIYAELDTYWLKKAGQDPLTYIQKFGGRMPILHLKDMTGDEEQQFAELGNGCIHFGPILQWGEQHGVEWYAVEQDECMGSPMDSLEQSLQYLNRWLETQGLT
ncbi:sugar phosphate isomerase/epimerase [Paenibacillus barcinonensis]|uniref:Sugar phosphate isomerase/epimerase n=1 Tax=Paenibacillus barcinonensis TaxID=198119 RepID=A0A2V4VTP7_PAEBA|nr:TIM barrel protein [Paenibacillus barcinonensis]PYE50170.1 sugar phosphate isomerase/epimerase [Paenibacillus barcinonensis]QKS54873.1 sugar phosphate isomerase/epimerase [Paenibacillus barcinonensis]